LTNRTSDVPRPLRRSTWRGAPSGELGEQGVPAGSQRSDRSSAASHPAPCQSVRPRSRSIRSRKPSKYVHSSAATSLAARGRPGPAFTISCCWREASHASRAAAILFPSDMAVSLGFCRYSPCLRMCHRMARPQGCVDHAVCLQPQTARQPLRCFFLCFVVQEDLRLPDSALRLVLRGVVAAPNYGADGSHGFEPPVPLAETSRALRRNGKCRRGDKSRLESGGPRVRIPVPPAASQVQTSLSGRIRL
jgi:hypothetical protein